MKVKIINIANRIVALHCNSGQTVYFPVGTQQDLEEVEIAGNPMFKKLEDNKLLQRIDEKPPKHLSGDAVPDNNSVAEGVAAKTAQPAAQVKSRKT